MIGKFVNKVMHLCKKCNYKNRLTNSEVEVYTWGCNILIMLDFDYGCDTIKISETGISMIPFGQSIAKQA